jgi:hypothetical protein
MKIVLLDHWIKGAHTWMPVPGTGEHEQVGQVREGFSIEPFTPSNSPERTLLGNPPSYVLIKRRSNQPRGAS